MEQAFKVATMAPSKKLTLFFIKVWGALLKSIVIALKSLFKTYHILISPWLGNRCRFTPTCSSYAEQSLDVHGLAKGLWLTSKRVFRCHPWGGGGYDPVPTKKRNNEQQKNHTDI